MTLRSPKQHSKTSTISQRLRNRADQRLSLQPPELSQAKALRSRRTTTLPTPRLISVDLQTEEAHTQGWESSNFDPFTRSNISGLYTRSNISDPSGLEQNVGPDLLLSQPLDHPPEHSPQRLSTDLEPLSAQSEPENFEAQPLFAPLTENHPIGDYELRLSTEPQYIQHPSVPLQDMSTLGYMMPAQYGSMGHYGSAESSGYPHHSYPEPRASAQQHASPGAYTPSYTSSPTAQDPKSRMSEDHTVLPPYQHSPIPRSPYQQPLGSMRTSPAPMAYPSTSSETSITSTPHTYAYPAVHANIPGQGLSPLASNTSSYPPPAHYPPTSYDVGGYTSLPPTLYPPSTTAAPYASYEPSSNPNGSASPSASGNGVMPRVLNSRPKPQCWEHGCNGRQFSTFSNLLRHQREKSGTAAKSYCPRCGAEFTRTTARNGHIAHEKCKARRGSESSSR